MRAKRILRLIQFFALSNQIAIEERSTRFNCLSYPDSNREKEKGE